MKKDIEFPKVENVAIAVVKDVQEGAEPEWNVYLINLQDNPLENVLVASTGYGSQDGEAIKTSTLRHFIGTVEAKSYAKVEIIKEDLFGLSNEYWVSFYLNSQIYDRKYVFVAESILESNTTEVPLLKKPGVMIL